MKERFLTRIIFFITLLAIGVLWLVSMFIELPLDGGFSIYWVIAILSAVAGMLYVLRGIFIKNANALKRLNIILGAGLLTVALLAIIQIYADLNKYALPIIAIIVSVALLMCVVIAGGRAWDSGDNQKPDYKNYRQRKAEEEQKKNDVK